jgi:hypothetical protein
MEVSTVTSTRETTLLSSAVLLPSQAQLRPQTALRCPVDAAAMADASAWRGRPTTGINGTDAPTAAFQGGAIAGLGFADVLDHMVTDHKYSTRLGSSSCSPPV